MAEKDYEFSATYLDTVLRPLRRRAEYDAIYKKLSDGAKRLADDPHTDVWQPARPFEEIGEVATSVIGETAFEALTYQAMRERFGPIVMPMLKSSLAATNRSPVAVLKKLNDLVKVAMRGIEVLFQADGPTTATMQIIYPRPVSKNVLKSWMGVLRFVFEATSPGEVTEALHAPNGGAFQLKLKWSAPGS